MFLVPQPVDVLTQDPYAGRMERADPEPSVAYAATKGHVDHAFEPLAHLVGGLVREGDGQDRIRINASFPDQVGDPAGDYPRFAAARARQDQERSVAVEHSFPLRRVQLFKIIHGGAD